MKVLMLVIALFFCVTLKIYIGEIIDLENEVFILYSSNFEDYLIVNNDYELVINKEKLENYFVKKGYKIVFYDDLHFEIGFDYLIDYKREHYFYMVINDGD